MRTEPMAIRASKLQKSFGRTIALDGVDLDVPQGSVVLVAGPNGAGKTTLLRLLLDLLPADGGEAEVLGRRPAREGARIRSEAGYLPEAPDFPFGRMRVAQALKLEADFRPDWDAAYAERLADALELRMEQRWKELSKGEARRAQFVGALAHRPPLLLLDEPTDGLDPLIRERALGLLAEHLAETGATLLYCTHVLQEAQTLADRLLVLGAGRVRVEGGVEELRRAHRRVLVRAPAGVGEAGAARPPFFLREEGCAAGVHRWIVRAGDGELRAWSESTGLRIERSEAVSASDIALAYLAEGDAA